MLMNEYIKDYVELLKTDLEKYEEDYLRLQERIVEESVIVRGGPVPITYQGYFYDEDNEQDFHLITKKMMEITHKVTEEYLKNPEYRKLFEFDERLEELILLDPGYNIPVTVGRYDLFYNGSDDYKFIEFNTDGTSGMNEDRILSRLLFETEGMKDFSKLYEYENIDLLESLIDEYLDLYEEITGRTNPNIAIVDILERGTTSEFLAFQKGFEKRGINCEIIDIRDLEYENGVLKKGDFEIDLMYRRFVIREFMKVYDEVSDFLQAYKDQAFLMFGSFRNQIVHTKLIFEVFHHPMTRQILNEDEWEFIQKVIPFTKTFDEPEDLKKVLKRPEKYILKPKEGYASIGVFTGRMMDKEEYEDRVREVYQTDYIYQEFFEMDSVPYVEFVDGELVLSGFGQNIGMMIYNEKFIAPYTRIGREDIISNEYDYYTSPAVRILDKKEK